ncbi:MAG: ABC transporter substrate-binding protein [Myxococcota bacterium]
MMPRITTVTLVGVLVASTVASAADNPMQRTEELVKQFKAVNVLPEDGSALSDAVKKENAATFSKLDAYFAWDRLTRDTIKPHKSKFSAKQTTAFLDTFRELIRLVAYPGGGDFFDEATYKLKMGKTSGKNSAVEMFAELESEDIETTVTFHWTRVDGALKIYDVGFDGASLVRDYRNQFGRLISKHGVDGLIERLGKKLAKERKAGVI